MDGKLNQPKPLRCLSKKKRHQKKKSTFHAINT